jgi:regulator of ribosome biosynthesis
VRKIASSQSFILFYPLSLLFSPHVYSLGTSLLFTHSFSSPRYGFGKANDDLKDWAIPAKMTDDGTVDPWAKRKKEKKERLVKGAKQQQQNLQQAQKFLTLSSSTPSAAAAAASKKKDLTSKSNLDRALVATRRSTASAGKFQKKLSREPREKNVYRKRDPLTPSSTASEKERSQKVVDRLLKKGSVLDVDKAVSVHKLQRERQRRLAKENVAVDGGKGKRKGSAQKGKKKK